jgi:hypothetical protein
MRWFLCAITVMQFAMEASAQLRLTSVINATAPQYSYGSGYLVKDCNKSITFTVTNTGAATIYRGVKLYLFDSGGNQVGQLFAHAFSLAAGASATFSSGTTVVGANGAMNGLGGTTVSNAGSYTLRLVAYTYAAGSPSSFDLGTMNFGNSTLVPTQSCGSCANPQNLTIYATGVSTAPTSASASVNPVNSGSSTTLSRSGGSLGTGASWVWYSGSCGGSNVGTGTSVSVSPASTTTYYVRAEGPCGNTTCASVTVSVNTPPGTPPNPANPTAGCGTTTITRNGTPPTNVLWYWQTTCGTSTALGSAATYNAPSSGTYYIRAYNQNTGLWSTGCGSVNITVNQNSTAPTSASANPTTINPGASSTVSVSGGALGTGATWRWYSGSCGGTLVGTGASISVSPSATTTYFVRAEGSCNTTTCASVTVNVNTPPGIPPNPANPTAGCNTTTITRNGTPPTNVLWYWQGTTASNCSGSTGVNNLGSGSTYSAPSSGTYYIRAYDQNSGLWSTGCGSVSVTVNQNSIAPTSASANPTTINPGASSTVSVSGGALGTGATWRWYSGSCGGTLVGTGASISVSPSATTTYFVRAEGSCNTTTCASVTVNVNTPPGIPPNPANPTAGCNTTTITRNGTPPTNVLWYWQGTTASNCSGSTGVNNLGSGSTYSAPSSGTYYIRAYDQNSGLWSTGCGSVSVTVNQNSTAPTSASANPTTINSGGSSTVSVSGGALGTGASWRWYSGSCGGTLVGTAASISVTPSSTTTYYVRAEGSCGNTACVSVPVTVNPTLSCTGCESVRLLTPLADATEMPRSVILTWEHTLGRGIQYYGLTVKPIAGGVPGAAISLPSSTNIAVPASGQKVSYAVPGVNYLNYGQQYEWEVYAYGANGQPISCGSRRFTVVAQPSVSLPEPAPLSAGIEYYEAHLGHMNNTLIILNGSSFASGSSNPANNFPNNGGHLCDVLTTRFYSKQYGINVDWKDGFASDTRFDFNTQGNVGSVTREGIQFFPNGMSPYPPQVGDMLVYANGASHVSLVSATSSNAVTVKQQNSRVLESPTSATINLTGHLGRTFNMSFSNGYYTIENSSVVGWRRAEPTIPGPGLSSSIPSLTPGSSLTFQILPSFSIFNQNTASPTYAQGATLYVNKYNSTTNCFESYGSKSFSSLDPDAVNNGVAGFQLPRGNTYQYRWLINYRAGGVWSEAFYFSISASNSSPLVNVAFSAVNVPEFLNVSNYSSLLAGAEHMQKVGNDWISVGTSNGYGNSSIWSMTGYQVGDSLLTGAPGYEQIRFSLSQDELTREHMNIPMLSSLTNPSDIIRPQVDLVTPSLPIASSGNFTFKVTAQNLDGFYVAQQDDDSDTYPMFIPSDTIVTLTTLDTGITNFKFVMYHGNDTIEVNKQVYVGSDTHTATLNSDANSSGSRVYWNSEFIGILSNSLNVAVPKYASNYLSVRKFGFEEQTFKISSDSIVNVALTPRPDFSGTETTFSVNPFGRPVYAKDITAQNIGGTPFTIGISRTLEDFVPRALDNESQTFRFRNTSSGSGTIRFAAILDQAQALAPNDIYLFVEYPAQSVKLNLDSLSGIGGYDSLVQKLYFNSFEILEGDGRVTLMRKQAPIAIATGINVLEDQPFSISIYDLFADPDSIPNDMTFNVTSSGVGFTYQVIGDTLYLTPEADWNGITDVEIEATHDWLTVSQSISVDISPVNDAPVIDELEPVQMCFGSELQVNLTPFLSDADHALVDITIAAQVTGASAGATESDITVSVIGQSLQITSTGGAAGGVYQVSIIADDDTDQSDAVLLQVTVTPEVVVSIEPTSAIMCNGQAVQLWANGASAYSWTMGSQPAGSNDSLMVQLAVPGVNSIAVSVVGTEGNCQGVANFTVPVVNGPSVQLETSSTELCLGDSTLISASGANSYVWQSAEPFQALANDQIWAMPGADAFYNVTGSVGSGCDGSQSVFIEVNPLPASPQIIDLGGTLQSSEATGNQWYLEGQPLSGETGATLSNPVPGSYTVEYTDANGCSQMSVPYTVLVTGIGGSLEGNGPQVYPNPNAGTFTVRISGVHGTLGLRLMDAIGRTVSLQSVEVDGALTKEYRNVASGVYTLETVIAEERWVQRMVVY